MTLLTLEIKDINSSVICRESGESIGLEYNGEFREGDTICIHLEDTDFVAVQLDETMCESIVFVPNHSFVFTVPYGKLRAGYAPEAFLGGAYSVRGRDIFAPRHIAQLSRHAR